MTDLYTACTIEGDIIDTAGHHQPTGAGYVHLGTGDWYQTLTIEQARRLTISLLLAVSDAMGNAEKRP